MNLKLLGLTVIGLFSAPIAANASTLVGADVSIQDFFNGAAHTPSGGPGGGGPYTITSADTATTDQFKYGDGNWEASFTGTQIVFTFLNSVEYNSASAYTSGPISIEDGPLVTYNEALSSVTVDAATTAINFKSSDITETLAAGEIGISWQLQPFTAGQTVVLDVTPAAPVPLPATAWLMLSGLAGLGVMARKRNAA